MGEYIEREALQAALQRKKAGAANGRYTDGWNDCLMRCKSVVSCFPAADVAPVRHGRWDDSGRYTFPSGALAVRCTNCGCALTESEYRLYNWNYCPVCGAKIEGETEGSDG